MRLCSFDVFDTLVTRTVADPTDLFEICGGMLATRRLISAIPGEWASQRARAEVKARALAEGAEPSLPEIYALLAVIYAWDDAQQAEAAQIEMEAESAALVPIPGTREIVARARSECEQVLFLSDMYLPEEFVEELLRKNGFFETGDRLYLSNAHRASKSAGSMFPLVRRDFPSVSSWRHWGDNSHSDVEMPRRNGVNPTLLPAGRLSPWESQVRRIPTGSLLQRSRLAGAMRLARLAGQSDHARNSELWNLGSNVAGPMLFGFVAWILDQSIRRGIPRLYFVARDGEILLRIARILCQRWNLPLDCRYLHGSRQAWHAAAVGRIGEFEKRWLIEPDIPLSLAEIARRLEVPCPEIAREFGRRQGKVFDPEQPLSPEELAALWQTMGEDPLVDTIRHWTTRKRASVIGYLEQEGFLDATPKAIVDIGWRGNMQRSLAGLLAADGRESALTGFYFGLVEDVPPNAGFHSFWQDVRGEKFPSRRARLMEIFTSGREGSTLSYAFDGKKFAPVLNRPLNREALDWGLLEFQRGVESLASRASQTLAFNPSDVSGVGRVAADFFLDFCDRPSPAVAGLLGEFRHAADQQESHFIRMLAPDLRQREFSRYAWDRKAWNSHPWIEGQLAILPCAPVQLAQTARRWLRKIAGRRG